MCGLNSGFREGLHFQVYFKDNIFKAYLMNSGDFINTNEGF